MTTKNIVISSLATIILISLIVSKVMSTSAESAVVKSSIAKTESIIPIKVYIVKPEKISDRIIANGTLMSNDEVELKSEISGKITKIFFTEGAVVKRNQLLLKINDSELQAQLEKATLSRKLASEKEKIQKALLDKNAISQQEYDVSQNDFLTLKADEDLIKARIDKTEIKAPFDGIVGLKFISEGSYITPDKIIATVQDMTPIKIDFSVPEKYAHKVKKGMKVQFKVQGIPESLIAEVYAIEPKINSISRTLQIRAIYPNKDAKILPGAFADIDLIVGDSDKEIAVPTEAVIPELNGQKIFLYKSGKVVSKMVETGIRTTDKVQITKGLAISDTVIITGIMQIRPGVDVKITE